VSELQKCEQFSSAANLDVLANEVYVFGWLYLGVDLAFTAIVNNELMGGE
jgi:hypothetical protein